MKKLTDEEREKDHVASYWEDRHHNTKWSDESPIDLFGKPHNMSMRNLKDIEDEGIFEVQLTARLPREA